MNELETLIEKHYKKKKGDDLFDFQSLLEMVEKTIGNFSRLALNEETASALSFKNQTYKANVIPIPNISEIAWGSLSTPTDAHPISDDARYQLARYLKNIEGTNIKQKIQTLNDFFEGKDAPTSFENNSDRIQKVISYLVFYKTLTTIITNFNASSAGFAFESFLAVLLDADSGRQIPASAGSTIADIIVYQGSLPISLKLYSETSLKVGGSYRQLVEDLTDSDKADLMQYIAVTKDLKDLVKGDPLSRQGTLTFYGFNFTLDNFLEILNLKEKEASLFQLPKSFWNPNISQTYRDIDFEQTLMVPTGKEVDLGPIVSKFKKGVESSLARKGFSPDEVDEVMKNLEDVIDSEGNFIESGGRFTYNYKNTSILTNSGNTRRHWKNFFHSLPFSIDKRNIVRDEISKKEAAAEKARTEKGAGSARTAKMNELKYQNGKRSLQKLLDFRDSDRDLYKFSLRHTKGYVMQRQFELSKGIILGLDGFPSQDNLLPYGEVKIGSLQIGRANLEEMLERTITSFNESIFSMFNDLQSLSSNLNNYVAGGLTDEALVVGPGSAQNNAEDIVVGTKEIVKK